MNSQDKNSEEIPLTAEKRGSYYWKWIAVGFVGVLIFTKFFNVSISPRFGANDVRSDSSEQKKDSAGLEKKVLPSGGVTLPINWNALGAKMIEFGVIDKNKFESLYAGRGGLDNNAQKLLYGERNERLTINEQNSGFILNLLWALGLANKNPILEKGPMMSPRYGGDASRFASTGGWTLAEGDVMDHYSKHVLVTLTEKQQKLVERVSQNIYRPCCGNSTYFPDCNHGMAMLGLLELMASQGISEEGIYKTALQVNSYWFPDTYLTIAKYFKERGIEWNDISPKEILGSAYSSAQGYRQILAEVEPQKSRGGGGCGI